MIRICEFWRMKRVGRCAMYVEVAKGRGWSCVVRVKLVLPFYNTRLHLILCTASDVQHGTM